MDFASRALQDIFGLRELILYSKYTADAFVPFFG